MARFFDAFFTRKWKEERPAYLAFLMVNSLKFLACSAEAFPLFAQHFSSFEFVQLSLKIKPFIDWVIYVVSQ